MLKKFFRKENGSITLFVLLAMLFFIIVIFSVFVASSNKEQSQASEVDKIKQEYEESVNNIDQIYNETLIENLSSLLKIGDYVNYTYDTVSQGYNLLSSESGYSSDRTINQKIGMKWRILNIHEDGKVDLIGDVSPSDSSPHFSGALGYNNSVYLLHDICKTLYSNHRLGIEARSINLEDIESQMNDTGFAARDAFTNSETGTQYRNSKTYTDNNAYYPNLYAQENGSGINTEEIKTDGIGTNEKGYTSPTEETSTKADSLTVTQTYYGFGYSHPSSYYDNPTAYDILFGTGTAYWLASRSVGCYSNEVRFGLRSVENTGLLGLSIFGSSDKNYGGSIRVRPIVSLDIKQILPCPGTADGTDTSIQHMHQIKGIYESN